MPVEVEVDRPVVEDATGEFQSVDEAPLAVPLGRAAQPEEVAALALFLASDESEWVTGTAQVVDGGLIVGTPWRKQPKVMTNPRPITMYDV